MVPVVQEGVGERLGLGKMEVPLESLVMLYVIRFFRSRKDVQLLSVRRWNLVECLFYKTYTGTGFHWNLGRPPPSIKT